MEPFVLRGFLLEKKWPLMQLWTDVEYLRKKFGLGKRLRVRIGLKKKSRGEVLHDHKSEFLEFDNIGEMLEWMNGRHDGPPSSSTHWAYLDYRDILELMDEEEAAKVDWAKLGIIQMEGGEEDYEKEEGASSWHDSTLWIGSPGAYTPCHFDTYGFNLHAQIVGNKRWLLFPPKTSLLPTRLPYEESSVFSGLDVLGGPGVDERLAAIVPRVVTMGPGDLLFVPPKWWHSVQCVQGPNPLSNVSISVNKWFPVEEDKRESAKEAILKFIMAVGTNSGILNPKEHICLTEQCSIIEGDLDELAEFVQFRLDQFGEEKLNDGNCTELNGTIMDGSKAKRPRMDEEENRLNHSNWPTSQLNFFYNNFSGHCSAESVPFVKWADLRLEEEGFEGKKEENEVKMPAAKLKLELLEAISNSTVLDAILDELINRKKRGKEDGCDVNI